MRIGLEAEYWVIDEAGTLRDGRGLAAAHQHVTPEFVPCLIEVQTPPVSGVAALERELRAVLLTVLEAAEADGKRLVPLGTPLTPQPLGITTRRGALLERIYGPGIEGAKNCAGTHVHFEKGRVTRQLNLLTALDPALALVSSSPYYRGERLANCSRVAAYRTTSGAEFARYRDLWEYVDSTEEWERRIRERYEELRTIATDRGVAAETFTKWFQPENAVLTPVRLRTRSPTVEWRAPDTALPSQVLQLVEDIVPLVRQTEQKPVERGTVGIESDRIGIPSFPELHDIVAAAIDRGLEATAVGEYLAMMGFDSGEYRPITDRIDGAERIDEAGAKTVRLEFARELHEDARAL